ncbi:MAG: Blue-light-activated protein [Lentisphaerae bacterium ADurb.BinA184]|nr:MAG: Blue-light-activated protein [Lentisphaerae bacterium ADurb.BinA184]
MGLAILALSTLIQFSAAGLAVVLNRKAGRVGAFRVVVGALILMGIRRAIALGGALAPGGGASDGVGESVGLLTSCLALAGVCLTRGLFDHLARLRADSQAEAARRQRAEADSGIFRRKAEEATARLRESELQLRFVSDNLPGGMVYQIDSGSDGRERRFTYVSAGVRQLHELSVEEAYADPLRVYGQVCEEDRRLVAERERAAIRAMAPFAAEVQVNLPSGGTRSRLFASAPRRLSNGHLVWDGIELDITERRTAEEERQRIRTLEGLGTVAGGVAHDFNNLLTGVFGNIELAKLELPPDHPALASLTAAHQAMENARHLTTRLLTFAKGGHPVLQTVDIRRVIRDTVAFDLAGTPVAAHVDLADDLWPVKADAGQLAQVVSNLTINAKEAMPGGGNLHVRAENAHDTVGMAGPEHRGRFVKVTFRDEGVGIPPPAVERIFEPYFTTKETGNGLGLAITHRIVTRHGGHIFVNSTPDVGTVFTVFLPAAEGATEPSQSLGGLGCPEEPPRPSGHVLLMDDEEVVRAAASRMLEQTGCTAETVANGREAVRRYSAAMRDGGRFDVVILDLTVRGGMGGKETARELLAADPGATIIVSSGYASDSVLADPAAYGFAGGLVKPFQLRELEATLARAMQTRRCAAAGRTVSG